jgi:hypothetical protein
VAAQGKRIRLEDFSDPQSTLYLPCSVTDSRLEDAYAVTLRSDMGIATHGTITLRRDALVEVGGYDPNLRRAEDIALRLRLSRENEFAYTRRNLCTVFRGDDNLSGEREHDTPAVDRVYREELEYVLSERPDEAHRLTPLIYRMLREVWMDLAYEREARGLRKPLADALAHVPRSERGREWLRMWCIAHLPRPVVSAVRRVKGRLRSNPARDGGAPD